MTLRYWTNGRRARAHGPRQGPAREAFIYFINGAKERAPAAAMELIKRLA